MSDFKPVESIKILPSEYAWIYSQIHPLLIVTTFLAQFNALVINPVSTLFFLLLPLAASQAIFTILCLPPVQQNTDRDTSPPSASKQKSRKKAPSASPKASPNAAISTRISTTILSLLLCLIAGTPLLTLGFILFGAPLTTHLPQTILLAAHVAVLAGHPLVYTRGVSGEAWRQMSGVMVGIDSVYGASLGALFGAWTGAIPIPLDWDREWQKWPITIVVGAYIGYTVGGLSGRYIFNGRRIDFSSSD